MQDVSGNNKFLRRELTTRLKVWFIYSEDYPHQQKSFVYNTYIKINRISYNINYIIIDHNVKIR